MMHDDESAVSAIVGAVLLLALFSSAMTVWTITTLPDWKADKEELQQQRVQAVLGSLRSDVEALATRGETGPISASVPLQAGRVPLLQQTAARGSLGLAEGFDAQFSFPGASMYLNAGVPVATPGTATAVCAGACIQSIQGFLISLTQSSAGSGTLATLQFTGSAPASTVTATISHVPTGTCAGEVRLDVTDSVTGTLVRTPLFCAGSSPATVQLNQYRIDLLNPSYGLKGKLTTLTWPASLSMTPGSGVTINHALVYTDTAQALRVTGTGAAFAPINPIDGYRLAYKPGYFAYPNQDIAFEGGGVLVDAGGTLQAMATDPSFSMSVASGVGSMAWTLVELQGTPGSLSGSQGATVRITVQSMEDIVLVTPLSCNPCATITLDTPSAAGWANHLTLRAGLANAGSSATVVPPTQTTALSLSSGAGLPVTSGWVIHLRIIHATAVVT